MAYTTCSTFVWQDKFMCTKVWLQNIENDKQTYSNSKNSRKSSFLSTEGKCFVVPKVS